MSSSAVDPKPAQPTFPIAMWSFAVLLLVAEYVLAIFLFDAQRLPVDGRTEAFQYLGKSMPLFIVAITGALLVGIPPESERREIAEALREPRRAWPIFAGQLIAYGSALAITIFVFNPGEELTRPWVWIGLWAGSAICALLLWVAAVVPRAAVKPLLRPVTRALAAGLVIGVIALVAGASTSVLWRPMSMLTLDVVAFLLQVTGHEVIYVPEELIVGTPAYEVFVDRPCSGYEGIGLIAVMLGFYLFYFRKSLRFPTRFSFTDRRRLDLDRQQHTNRGPHRGGDLDLPGGRGGRLPFGRRLAPVLHHHPGTGCGQSAVRLVRTRCGPARQGQLSNTRRVPISSLCSF